MIQFPVRAEEYRARAAAELRIGSASQLDQVRAKHDRAAQVWIELAEADDLRELQRIARIEHPGVPALPFGAAVLTAPLQA